MLNKVLVNMLEKGASSDDLLALLLDHESKKSVSLSTAYANASRVLNEVLSEYQKNPAVEKRVEEVCESAGLSFTTNIPEVRARIEEEKSIIRRMVEGEMVREWVENDVEFAPLPIPSEPQAVKSFALPTTSELLEKTGIKPRASAQKGSPKASGNDIKRGNNAKTFMKHMGWRRANKDEKSIAEFKSCAETYKSYAEYEVVRCRIPLSQFELGRQLSQLKIKRVTRKDVGGYLFIVNNNAAQVA